MVGGFKEFLVESSSRLTQYELGIVDSIWKLRDQFIRWPRIPFLFCKGKVRISGKQYHAYSTEQIGLAKRAGVAIDSRSNGPAIMAFGIASGERPVRANGKGWSIHHIYDGQFPGPGRESTSHAVRDPDLFSEAAGLVAVHPTADALASEYAYFAWLLRHEAWQRFGLDPDGVFSGERRLPANGGPIAVPAPENRGLVRSNRRGSPGGVRAVAISAFRAAIARLGLSLVTGRGVRPEADFLIVADPTGPGVPVKLYASYNRRFTLHKRLEARNHIRLVYAWMLEQKPEFMIMTFRDAFAILGKAAARTPSWLMGTKSGPPWYTTDNSTSRFEKMREFLNRWDFLFPTD